MVKSLRDDSRDGRVDENGWIEFDAAISIAQPGEMKTHNWIFVTGAPRSSTTFVGKILSAPLEVAYLHEPFNPYCGMPGIDRLFLYLCRDGSASPQYREIIEGLFNYDFTLKTAHFAEDNLRQTVVKTLVGSRLAWSMRVSKLNPFVRSTVIKDPMGCLLAEYLAEHFDVKPVIIIRHPIGVVASTIRLNWQLNLDAIREQKELVEDYFSTEREFLSVNRTEPVEQAAALWRVLNKVLLNQASRHPSWFVIKHEALSANPLEYFRILYKGLDLPWSQRIEKKVIKLTRQKNAIESPDRKVHSFKRNSTEIFRHSLQMLSREQREKVYEITKDVALQLYPRDSFGLDTA